MEETRPDADAFAFERWDVYQVAVEFQTLVATLIRRRGFASLRDQMDRASASVLLNLAEGAGRFARAEKARFYLIARGSAMECVAALEIARSRGLIGEAEHRQARGLLARVSPMLTKLILRMQ
jgi:four helix bundle protein